MTYEEAEAAAWEREPDEVWEAEAAAEARVRRARQRRAYMLALAGLLAAEIREHDARAEKLRRRALALLEEATACRAWANATAGLLEQVTR